MRLMKILVLGSTLSAAVASAQQTAPVSHTQFDGPALTFEFPGLRIGVAEYEEGPTGTTVFHFPDRVMAVVDVRGGAPGTLFTDALRLGNAERRFDGIVFAGGSAYGLAATSGATAALKPSRVRQNQWQLAAIMPGAIIYDIGDRRLSTVTPDEGLGRAALEAAVEGRFPLGPRGAGRSAMQGGYFADPATGRADWPHSGQGGAFRQIGPTKVAVFTVVNAVGAVVDREGRVVRCSYAPSQRNCGTIQEAFARRLPVSEVSAPAERGGVSSNTTLTLVVTNQRLNVRELQRLAVQVHTSMARGIQPYSTIDDGDVLFAVSTAEVDNPALTAGALTAIASEAAWDAILASVPTQDPMPSTSPMPVSTAALARVAGVYEFPSGARVSVSRDGEQLRTTLTGMGGLFFAPGGNRLAAVAPGEFVIDGPRGDRVRFDLDLSGNRVMILNPGQWAQVARRVR
jgi:L-aminopeptidase/D-esterase-like protein